MGKKVRSMRGEIVDFNLQQIKSQMKSNPAPHTVRARQNFIDQKLRRRVKKVQDDLGKLDSTKVDRKIAEAPAKEQPKVDTKVEAKTTTTKKRTVKRKTTKTDTEE